MCSENRLYSLSNQQHWHLNGCLDFITSRTLDHRAQVTTKGPQICYVMPGSGKMHGLGSEKTPVCSPRNDQQSGLHPLHRGTLQQLINGDHQPLRTQQGEGPCIPHHPSTLEREPAGSGLYRASHQLVQGKAVKFDSVLGARSQQADILVEWTGEHQDVLMNIIDKPTHFPHMANATSTTPDLPFM